MQNQLVTLLRITTPRLGNFVKNKLEAEGIEIFFTNEGMTLGSIYNPDEVLLKVKAKQSEEAIKALLQLHKDYDLDKVAIDQSIADLKRILVPVKLSKECIGICQYAMHLAAKTKGEVKLLYVYPDPTFHEMEKHTASWEKHVKIELKEAFKKAQLALVNFSNELRKNTPADLYDSAKIHFRMLKGTPQNVIADACKRYEPDVVVMGTSRKKKKNGEFMGRTLVKVLDSCQYPVLAVPPKAEFKSEDQLNIMYSTNFYSTDNKALNKLLGILSTINKKIHCVHIDLNDDPDHQKKVEELNLMLAENYVEHDIKCELFESDNIVKGFDDFVKSRSIDIISMSKVRHTIFYKMFHSDLLKKLVSIETVPILIFPE